DGRTLAASANTIWATGRLRLWGLPAGKELESVSGSVNAWAGERPANAPRGRGTSAAWHVAFSPDGRMLALTGGELSIPIWGSAPGGQRLLLEGHNQPTACVAFSPDGRLQASASLDGTIYLWSLETRQQLTRFTGHRGKANSLAFSATGDMLISA